METFKQIENIVTSSSLSDSLRIERNIDDDITYVMWDVDHVFGGLCIGTDHADNICLLYIINGNDKSRPLTIQNKNFKEAFKRLILLLCSVNEDTYTFNQVVNKRPFEYLWLTENVW